MQSNKIYILISSSFRHRSLLKKRARDNEDSASNGHKKTQAGDQWDSVDNKDAPVTKSEWDDAPDDKKDAEGDGYKRQCTDDANGGW